MEIAGRGHLQVQHWQGSLFPKNEVAGTWSNYQRAWELSLDLNQCRRLREHHAKEATALGEHLYRLLTCR